MKTVRESSVRKLLAMGLIENKTDPAWTLRGSTYEITETGRAAAGGD